MEITWYGLSCFRLSERGSATVVTDPYDSRQGNSRHDDEEPMKLPADIVTISRETPGYNYLGAVKGTPYVITSPGEYEIGGVFITGIQTGGQKGSESAGEKTQEQNTLFVFDFDAFTIAHLGNLTRVLTQAEIEAMGTVNIALVPISLLPGGSNLDFGRGLSAARAAEVISLLEPNIVIPMHSANLEVDSLNKFLKEMGLSKIEKQPSLKTTKTTLPEEMQVIILDQQRGYRSNP
jgi:L-ascorbate metabolism protein UlaG (beta-lactamase superfamily)